MSGNDSILVTLLATQPGDLPDDQLWNLLNRNWNPSLSADELAEAGFKLLGEHWLTSNDSFVIAALSVLHAAYHREEEPDDPDVIYCLVNTLCRASVLLDQASLAEDAVAIGENGTTAYPNNPSIWLSLAGAYEECYKVSEQHLELKLAIAAARQALRWSEAEDRPLTLSTLSKYLHWAAENLGWMNVREEAFELMVQTCAEVKRNDVNRTNYQLNLAIACRSLAEAKQDAQRAFEAIRCAKVAARGKNANDSRACSNSWLN